MADKIAVNDENYTDLKSALEGKHEIILELLEKVIKDLQECEELNDARASMEQVYSSHASIIASFKNAIADLDMCC